jgi:CheY-like chemotaxis protein
MVIAEIFLPLIDGYALCEVLRRDGQTANVPILVVTSESRPAAWQRARDAGADTVLLKPTTPACLVSETARLLACGYRLRERSATLTANIATQLEKSAALLTRSAMHRGRIAQSRTHRRGDTTRPPASPPELICPSCDLLLVYDHSHVGGVSATHAEQWDYYDCAHCGAFQYRPRTRYLRRLG